MPERNSELEKPSRDDVRRIVVLSMFVVLSGWVDFCWWCDMLMLGGGTLVKLCRIRFIN